MQALNKSSVHLHSKVRQKLMGCRMNRALCLMVSSKNIKPVQRWCLGRAISALMYITYCKNISDVNQLGPLWYTLITQVQFTGNCFYMCECLSCSGGCMILQVLNASSSRTIGAMMTETAPHRALHSRWPDPDYSTPSPDISLDRLQRISQYR